jgi:predicted DNA-binding protein (UPF0278 family)
MLHPGRRIWVVCKAEERHGWKYPAHTYDTQIQSFRKFLPRGAYNTEHGMVERKQSLVQLYTDPGGVRTIAVANIRLRDPAKSKA